ncbi:hypothetical protein V1264_000373 [Littorina saxatilis]
MDGSPKAGVHQSKSLTAKAGGSGNITVCVEGNIGSGKTTLLDYFRTKPGVEVIQEPVEMWRNVRGHNALEQMYQDPSRWSMTLQTYVQLTMLDIHTRPQKEPVRMMERSIHSARYCFVQNLHNSGNMSDIEFVILDEWYQWILRSQDVHADRIVYLETSPETCHDRIMKRCRSEETGIPIELLQNLHTLHEDWLKHKRFPLQASVLVIDADCDDSSIIEKYREHEDWIMGRTAAS